MSEEMQKQLARILELMLNGLEKAGEVANKELPGLIEDYLRYFMVDLIPLAELCFLAGSTLVLYLAWKNRKIFWNEDLSMAEPWVMFLIFPFAGLITSLCLFISAGKEMLKINYAPKAYLIEKLRK